MHSYRGLSLHGKAKVLNFISLRISKYLQKPHENMCFYQNHLFLVPVPATYPNRQAVHSNANSLYPDLLRSRIHLLSLSYKSVYTENGKIPLARFKTILCASIRLSSFILSSTEGHIFSHSRAAVIYFFNLSSLR